MASAAPRHHFNPRPAPVMMQTHHHHRANSAPLIGLIAGVTGYALGSAINYNQATIIQAQSNNYALVNDKECFVIVSQSTGNITQKCVFANGGNNQILYVD